MRQLVTTLFFLCLSLQWANAQEFSVLVDGESFSKKSMGKASTGERFVEFIRETETFDSWTKLVAFRYQELPALGNDPKVAASAFGQVLRAANPNTPFSIIENDQEYEALIDFVARAEDGQSWEYNVWRYAKSSDGGGLVSLQFAYRFTDVSVEGMARLKKMQSSWIEQVRAYDIATVRKVLIR